MSSHTPAFSTPDPIRVPHHREVPFQLPEASSPAGQRRASLLHDTPHIWLTTVDEAGVPHSLPLAFLWDEANSTFLI